ncbi:hypothetical protein E2C01_018360 [Portunus trituberculatus]|uniref:Uncharacterized protein n=1 Tax=Portunus trituberculatus TaxID=210409 RepID=A0A5B7DVB1_PORTR|nr:hypothetical protein [Portunus trituberculatus]
MVVVFLPPHPGGMLSTLHHAHTHSLTTLFHVDSKLQVHPSFSTLPPFPSCHPHAPSTQHNHVFLIYASHPSPSQPGSSVTSLFSSENLRGRQGRRVFPMSLLLCAVVKTGVPPDCLGGREGKGSWEESLTANYYYLYALHVDEAQRRPLLTCLFSPGCVGAYLQIGPLTRTHLSETCVPQVCHHPGGYEIHKEVETTKPHRTTRPRRTWPVRHGEALPLHSLLPMPTPGLLGEAGRRGCSF